MPEETIQTALTDLFKIKYPIMLAGMNQAAGPRLAAAVTNAGGIGVIGGMTYTPKMLRKSIQSLKKDLINKDAAFGIDLLLPQVGGGARKTNKDYTKGKLPQLIDIIIEEKAKLFVSAVGVPPKWAVEKLHAAGIPVMNMVGAPKHVPKALDAGVDIICAQGGEGGGHTGEVATSILVPACVDLCRGKISPLTGKQVSVVAAGGISDGRGVAMAFALGAEAVWVGTRFICATEASAPKRHKKGVVGCGYHDTQKTLIYTGRPLRVLATPFVKNWNENRQDEIKKYTSSGLIPVAKDIMDAKSKLGKVPFDLQLEATMPMLMGQVAGAVNEIKPAAQIVEEMMTQAISVMRGNHTRIAQSKL